MNINTTIEARCLGVNEISFHVQFLTIEHGPFSNILYVFQSVEGKRSYGMSISNDQIRYICLD